MDENHQSGTTEVKIWLPPSYLNRKYPSLSPTLKKRKINWGFADKSFWEWIFFLAALFAALGAIAIPFVVTILGLNLTQQQAQLSISASERQHQTDLSIAQDQQQAAILQTYLDNIQDLLLNHRLLASQSDDDVAILARARTLTALQGLDPERKGRLLQFLYEAKLIGVIDNHGKTYVSIINLTDADLSGVNLSGVNLFGADLSGANLSGADLGRVNLNFADLSKAVLKEADLSGATLSGANLFGTIFYKADLSKATLSGADLQFANLSGATLSGTDLRVADNLNQQQLDEVFTCKDAILPKGLTCHHT